MDTGRHPFLEGGGVPHLFTYWIKVEMREASDALCFENPTFKMIMTYPLEKHFHPAS